MRLIGFLANARKAKHLAEVAVVVARRCRTEVFERCERKAIYMGAAEARGYIRARAAAVIHAEAARMLHVDAQLDASQATELVHQATEAVVELVHATLMQRTRGVVRRRAA